MSVYYTNKKINFGGLFIFLLECNNLKKLFQKNTIKVIFTNKNLSQEKYKKYKKYFGFLDFNFPITYRKYVNYDMKGLLNIDLLFDKKFSYQTTFLSLLSKNNNLKPIIKYKKNLNKKISIILKKKKIRNYITIHLNINNKSPLSAAKISFWKKLVDHLLKKNLSLQIIFVGFKKEFYKHDRVHYSYDIFKNDIYSFFAVSNSKFFIGNASGYCCAAIFSNTPYLIIKNPNHHKMTIKDEIKNLKLDFANNDQLIIRSPQSFDYIRTILRKFNKLLNV